MLSFPLSSMSLSISSSRVCSSCPTLCDPMDCSMAGLPVYHQPPESTQAHVHLIGDAIQPSHPLIPFSSCLQSFPASRSFPMSQLLALGGHSIGTSASASVLPVSIQGWFPLGLTGLISLMSKGDSQESSPTPQFESISINSLALTLLYSPTLTSIHDFWKNHSFDYIDLCQRSDISAFLICFLGLS